MAFFFLEPTFALPDLVVRLLFFFGITIIRQEGVSMLGCTDSFARS